MYAADCLLAAGARLSDQRPEGGGEAAEHQASPQAQSQHQGQLQRMGTLTDYERNQTAKEFALFVCEVLQQL